MDFEKQHILSAGDFEFADDAIPDGADGDKWRKDTRKRIEPWLSALFQSEHLSLLVGSGMTTAVAYACGAKAAGMRRVAFGTPHENELDAHIAKKAAAMGRGEPNLEDQLSAAIAMQTGLEIAGLKDAADQWSAAIDTVLKSFLTSLLETERAVAASLEAKPAEALSGLQLLTSFLLSFASRTPSRERLHLFTTNYDRLIEFAADLAGIRLIDRFVGTITPIFRASRLHLDMHYNPPGIRGEPRLLEGVAHLTKLHGSLDWQFQNGILQRLPIRFGAGADHPDIPEHPSKTVMIYPNSAKDFETAGYPYAELFRDMSAAVCRPNSTVVTYGYGFGDDHINRVLADMLTIPSTHLVVISYGFPGAAEPHGRVDNFLTSIGRPHQTTLMLGQHFGDLNTLVENYLPRPAMDPISFKMSELLQRRGKPDSDEGDAKDIGDLFK